MSVTTAIVHERRQLTGLAYRLLGSLSDAEDVVQEAFARWYALSASQREAIESPGAWLTTVAARLCLDLLGSARVRRERYVGEWLPEPVPEDPLADPADRVALAESVTIAFLVVLDAMTPAERVAFVLHDVFGYPFAEVAAVLDRSAPACRQLASAARRRVRVVREPAPARAGVVRAFKAAWEAKDIDGLIGLLDPEATLTADGGGLAAAVLRPVEGRERIAGYAVGLAARVSAMTLAERTVNGRPGLVASQDGVVVAVIAFDIAGDSIRRVWAVRNPEKLRRWQAAAA
ncbi:RNA polymerase sigma factor SigJ [Amycolatopsis eburnea]|uniref:Sigma-70 family RNA polymerase sigma factor n=1 Tax=Amycolatopsis eburnea TaxID=2267691 RepID=A0A3R9DUN5_9PSEU|nr:RNA polymerase sigma factor SigJ [Amycolatopsis eburnea]RSD13930.1 sigma-70 family RNA polymerase sigma factor [Amycolatopsis eburnea]